MKLLLYQNQVPFRVYGGSTDLQRGMAARLREKYYIGENEIDPIIKDERDGRALGLRKILNTITHDPTQESMTEHILLMRKTPYAPVEATFQVPNGYLFDLQKRFEEEKRRLSDQFLRYPREKIAANPRKIFDERGEVVPWRTPPPSPQLGRRPRQEEQQPERRLRPRR